MLCTFAGVHQSPSRPTPCICPTRRTTTPNLNMLYLASLIHALPYIPEPTPPFPLLLLVCLHTPCHHN